MIYIDTESLTPSPIHNEWAVQRCRYMTLVTMNEVSEEAVPMLAAVAS